MPAGYDLSKYIKDLNARLKLPPGLKAMGVKESMVPALSEAAMQDHSTLTNQRPLDKTAYARLFREAMA